MKQLNIRRATIEDSEKVLYYIKALAQYEGILKDVSVDVEDIKNHIFQNSHARVLLLSVGEEEIGFAVYFYTLSTFLAKPTLYLEDMYIEDNYRGKGYGKEVLAFLARHAKENDCARFEWSCLDWLKPSIEFYKGLGATPMKEWLLFRLDGDELNSLADEADEQLTI